MNEQETKNRIKNQTLAEAGQWIVKADEYGDVRLYQKVGKSLHGTIALYPADLIAIKSVCDQGLRKLNSLLGE